MTSVTMTPTCACRVEKERVDPTILEAIGYGETQPIASNRIKAGKAQNRRVEFKVAR